MAITVKRELDPIFETFSLLCLSDVESWREESIRQLNECGISGEVFFQKHCRILEKYIRTFLRYKVETSQEKKFCQQKSEEIYMLLAVLVTESREYLDRPEDADYRKLRQKLAYCMVDTEAEPQIRSEEDIPDLSDERILIDFIEKADIRMEEKWFVLDMLRKPDLYLEKIMEMIRLNIPAFEKAKEAVWNQLDKLLQKKGSYEENKFTKIAGTYAETQVIYASLAMPLLQLILLSFGYQGVLLEYLQVGKKVRDYPRELVIRQAKALSDKSKLDILCELKRSQKFNLELAESLGLSPSTVSHHMNALLICDFVTVEKRDGKVYYCLQKDTIRDFLLGIEELLL